jgi:hypothetical protein
MDYRPEEKTDQDPLAADLEGLLKRVRSDVTQRQQAGEHLASLLTAYKQKEPVTFKQKEADELCHLYPEAEPVVQQLQVWCEAALMAFRIDYDKRFRDACAAWCSDAIVDGHFPRYTVNHVIDIEVDLDHRRTRINAQTLKTLQLKGVIEAIQREDKRLWRRPFQPQEVIEELYDAYRQVVALHRVALGDDVSLLEVHRMIFLSRQSERFMKTGSTSALVPYSRDQFAVDLSKFLQSGITTTGDGLRFRLVPIPTPTNALLIYFPDRGSREWRGLLHFRRDT